jgi:hypothetical protein
MKPETGIQPLTQMQIERIPQNIVSSLFLI